MKIIYYRHNKKSIPMALDKTKLHFCEITIVLEGSLRYVIDGKKFRVSSGDIIFVPSKAIRDRYSNTPTEYVSFNFIESSADDFVFVYERAVNDVVRNLVATCDSVKQRSVIYDDPRLCLLLSCLIEDLHKKRAEAEEHPLVRRIKKYIRSNIEQKLSLAKIGEAMNFSPVYCSAVFKKSTGRSIMDYVLDLRIQEALFLLVTEPSEISSIAARAGFENYNYFTRIFKKRIGFTPSAYKKKHLHSPPPILNKLDKNSEI